jgi:hypothetical protein
MKRGYSHTGTKFHLAQVHESLKSAGKALEEGIITQKAKMKEGTRGSTQNDRS